MPKLSEELKLTFSGDQTNGTIILSLVGVSNSQLDYIIAQIQELLIAINPLSSQVSDLSDSMASKSPLRESPQKDPQKIKLIDPRIVVGSKVSWSSDEHRVSPNGEVKRPIRYRGVVRKVNDSEKTACVWWHSSRRKPQWIPLNELSLVILVKEEPPEIQDISIGSVVNIVKSKDGGWKRGRPLRGTVESVDVASKMVEVRFSERFSNQFPVDFCRLVKSPQQPVLASDIQQEPAKSDPTDGGVLSPASQPHLPKASPVPDAYKLLYTQKGRGTKDLDGIAIGVHVRQSSGAQKIFGMGVVNRINYESGEVLVDFSDYGMQWIHFSHLIIVSDQEYQDFIAKKK